MPDPSPTDVGIPALLYHHVGTPAAEAWPELTVSPHTFRRQMRLLSLLACHTITASDFVAWRRGERQLPANPVLLTFDDAYDDLPIHAFPVLQEYGLNATVFVVTNQIGGDNAWDIAAGRPRRQLMAADPIRTWSRQGIDFGAHSRSHADLCACSATQLEEEVAGSRADLQQLLGKPVLSFAYPFGRHDQRVRACVLRHFAAAFTCDQGLNSPTTDLDALHRVIVGPKRPFLDHLSRLYRGANAPHPISAFRGRLARLRPSSR